MKTNLINKTEIVVRFSEVDALNIVWHGNYIKYFEDGRESFGNEYNIGYWDIYKHGYIVPVIKINIDYKLSLTFGDIIIVETEYIDSEAAKIIMNYTIRKKNSNTIVATGSTTQVFLSLDKQLQLYIPEFFLEWKNLWGLLQ